MEPVIFLHKHGKNARYEDIEFGAVSRTGVQSELMSCSVPNRGNARAVEE